MKIHDSDSGSSLFTSTTALLLRSATPEQLAALIYQEFVDYHSLGSFILSAPRNSQTTAVLKSFPNGSFATINYSTPTTQLLPNATAKKTNPKSPSPNSPWLILIDQIPRAENEASTVQTFADLGAPTRPRIRRNKAAEGRISASSRGIRMPLTSESSRFRPQVAPPPTGELRVRASQAPPRPWCQKHSWFRQRDLWTRDASRSRRQRWWPSVNKRQRIVP